jgi:hypothetical protein
MEGIVKRRYWCRTCNIEYIEVCKVACTSIKIALLVTDRQNVPGDLIRIHHNPYWRPEEVVNSDLTFTFVRHPLDRLVSCYFDKVKTGHSHEMNASLPKSSTLRDFVRFICTNPNPDPHYANQCRVFRRKPNWIGRYETLAADWKRLQTLYPQLVDLPHSNKSDRPREWKGLFDPDTLAMATNYYRPDFERWPEYR